MFSPDTRILIADDMVTMRKLVSKICRELGFSSFVEAPDGAVAWEVLVNATPPIQLIISDWNMPNSTGLDFLKKVRDADRFKHLPFLMVTAEAELSQVSEAVAAGVDNYVIKPFSAQNLKDKLEAIYKKKPGK